MGIRRIRNRKTKRVRVWKRRRDKKNAKRWWKKKNGGKR